MQEPTDDEWLRAALTGDKTAYSRLVRRHQRPLLRHLVRLLGSPDDAMELTQEAFVRAWQALPQWQPDAQFRTWLFRIASNAALEETGFVESLRESGRQIQAHRERMVREIMSAQPAPAVIERERSAIFALQEAQQRAVIAQLLKEREMLSPAQRAALAELLLAHGAVMPGGR